MTNNPTTARLEQLRQAWLAGAATAVAYAAAYEAYTEAQGALDAQ